MNKGEFSLFKYSSIAVQSKFGKLAIARIFDVSASATITAPLSMELAADSTMFCMLISIVVITPPAITDVSLLIIGDTPCRIFPKPSQA